MNANEIDRFPFFWSLVGKTNFREIVGKSPATFAIQSRGEMAKEGQQAIASRLGVDLDILNDATRKLVAEPRKGVQILKLRPPDIIRGLKKGIIDMAILGADYVLEDQLTSDWDALYWAKQAPSNIIPVEKLEFGSCTFSIGFPFTDGRNIPLSQNDIRRTLQSGITVTSLPNTLKYLLNQSGINLEPKNICTMEGSVEAGIMLYGAVAIADRVSTGNTMFANGIRPDLDLIEFPGAYLVASRMFLEKQGVRV